MRFSTRNSTISTPSCFEMMGQIAHNKPLYSVLQTNLFGAADLLQQLDPADPLRKLSMIIPWQDFDIVWVSRLASWKRASGRRLLQIARRKRKVCIDITAGSIFKACSIALDASLILICPASPCAQRIRH